MSSLKSGRRKKILNLKCSNIVPTEFDSARFASVLLKLGGDPSKWSLRKEWILFHQTYFSTSSSRSKQARSCYDFYRRHLVKADGGGTSMSDNVNDVNLMGDFIPRSHLDKNDSVMPRGNTNVANVDNIVLKTFFVKRILASIQMTTMITFLLVMTVTSIRLKTSIIYFQVIQIMM